MESVTVKFGPRDIFLTLRHLPKTLPYSFTEGGSAVAGTDYMPTQIKVSDLHIPIEILATDNDFVVDEDKTFNVVLTVKDNVALPPERFRQRGFAPRL